MIDHIEVRNLAAAIEEIKAQGFVTVGLDSEGPVPIETGLSGSRIALVLGAEGKGLRQKTRETVDTLVRLDMPGAIKSLNVSNATAIALLRGASNFWADPPPPEACPRRVRVDHNRPRMARSRGFLLYSSQEYAIRIPAALVAQLVEHLICNQGVAGSNPAGGTTISLKTLHFLKFGKCGVFDSEPPCAMLRMSTRRYPS